MDARARLDPAGNLIISLPVAAETQRSEEALKTIIIRVRDTLRVLYRAEVEIVAQHGDNET